MTNIGFTNILFLEICQKNKYSKSRKLLKGIYLPFLVKEPLYIYGNSLSLYIYCLVRKNIISVD